LQRREKLCSHSDAHISFSGRGNANADKRIVGGAIAFQQVGRQ
jgi:hypothetical protein